MAMSRAEDGWKPPRARRRCRLRIATPLVLATLLALPTARPAHATLVEGVRFHEALEAEGQDLVLAGTGLLRWYFLKAYVAALYLAPDARAEDALRDVPKRLEIEYFHDIGADGFVRATVERIAANVSARELEALRPKIEAMNRLYRDVKAGDRYALTYVPGRGTELALNGQPLGRVTGPDFARAIFAIWLGDEPLDGTLKAQLLGRADP